MGLEGKYWATKTGDAGMTDQPIEVNCRDCGDPFPEKDIKILGVILRLGGGRCSKCRKKYIKEGEDREAATRAQEIATQRYSWRTGSGIPLKFMTTEFGNFDKGRPGNVKYAHQQCLKYAEGFPLDYHSYIKKKGKAYPSLVLMSPGVWGVGKTHLVAAIGHRIFNRWNGEDIVCPVKFITESGLFNQIQATYSYNNEDRKYLPSEARILAELTHVPLLIIDDIGKEQRSDPRFVQRKLYALIDARYGALRPVVLTTNLDDNGLMRYLGGNNKDEAIIDRLTEMCSKEYFIKIKGESYRRK